MDLTVAVTQTLRCPRHAVRGHWEASGVDAAASVLVVTGRGSFRPIQSSLTKAALSRPIMPKVLPPQATGHLASKFL